VDKKLILSARLTDNRVDVTRVLPSSISPEKWVQGVVQAVNNYGLFIRPAGMDSVGLLHQSRIPRDLISSLKKLAPISAEGNKSDIESLFQVGDVLKFRVQNVTDNGKLELSAVPFRQSDEEEEEYNIIEDEDAEDEGKPAGESSKGRRRSRDDNILAEDSVADEDSTAFNPNSVLIWWRGKPYVGPSDVIEEVESVDEEIEVLGESRDVQEGTWRRLFELDMREDEADFSVKAMEAELKELEEEIGELHGLDEDLEADDFGLGAKFFGNRVGASVGFSIPAEWRDKLSYLQEMDETIKIKSTLLKGGKKADNLELEGVIREAEQEIERRASQSRRVPSMGGEMTGQEVAMDAPVVPEAMPIEAAAVPPADANAPAA
jgi:predicted RNA-binding protein with RPS1 domain